MHEIKHLAEEIREELGDAEKYAREAVKHAEDPEDASTYADLSRQELGHANRLHEMAVRHIEKAKDAGHHPTEAMQAVWDWEHERMLDRTAHVKTLLSMM